VPFYRALVWLFFPVTDSTLSIMSLNEKWIADLHRIGGSALMAFCLWPEHQSTKSLVSECFTLLGNAIWPRFICPTPHSASKLQHLSHTVAVTRQYWLSPLPIILVWRPRRKWEYNIKMDPREIGWYFLLDLSGYG